MAMQTVRIEFEDGRVAYVTLGTGPAPVIAVRGLRNVVSVEYDYEEDGE